VVVLKLRSGGTYVKKICERSEVVWSYDRNLWMLDRCEGATYLPH
jgi:hypothetical protein